MKKILIYILIFTSITGSLFGVFGGVNNVLAQTDVDGSSTTPSGDSTTPSGQNDEKKVKESSNLEAYNLPVCINLTNFNVGSCITVGSYYVQQLAAITFQGSGILFNKMLAFSMDSAVINQDFVNTTWGATRGFANMLFILVLVVISISIILNVSTFSNKRLITRVIIIALAVNFSLFASRVVIDAGNILALGFYNAMPSGYSGSDVGSSSIEQKNISGVIVEGFDPTQMFSADSFLKWREKQGEDNQQAANAMLSIVFLMSAGILFYSAYIFLAVSFVFAVRIAWLWIIMALAPLAFISYTVPQLEYLWKRWWNELINRSFAIAVFMFLIWLTLMIVTSNYLETAFGNLSGNVNSIVDFIVIIFLQFMIVITLLRLALSTTQKLSNDGGLGDKVFGMVKGAGLLAAGVATGGTTVAAGIAARKTIGGLGAAAASRITTAQEGGSMTGTIGRMALRGAKGLESYKFGTKEGYKEQVERVAGEEKALARGFKDQYEYETTIDPTTGKRVRNIKLDSSGNKVVERKASDIEKEFYEKRQKVGPVRTVVRTLGVAGPVAAPFMSPFLAAAAPLAFAVESRAAGTNKATKDYLERRQLEENNEKLQDQIKNKQNYLSDLRDQKEKAKKENNESLMKSLNEAINEESGGIEKMKADVKKKEEKIKKLKGEDKKGGGKKGGDKKKK